MKERLLKALLRLRENGPLFPIVGLCSNVPTLLRDPLRQCFADLGLDSAYPVPPPEDSDESAEQWFDSADAVTMWNPEHPYGAARLALLGRLIEHLEATK